MPKKVRPICELLPHRFDPVGGSHGVTCEDELGRESSRKERAGTASDLAATSLALDDLLRLPAFSGTKVIAGRSGLDRAVERLNVMEVPDILPWVKPRELLLTTAYPLRNDPDRLPDLVGELAARGLAGLAIKLGRYLDELPAGMLERADTCGFPLLLLPDDVAFDDILHQVLSEILNRQAARLEQSEAVHRTLLQIVLTGGGLGEIAEQVAALLGCPVVVAGPDGAVLASGSLGDLEKTLRAVGLLRDDRLHLPVSRDTPSTVGLPAVRHLTVPISTGGALHGSITAIETDRPLGDTDALALENASTVAALAISQAKRVAAVRARIRADLIVDLLDGRLRTRDEAVIRAASVGWRLDRALVVLVAQPDNDARGTVIEGVVGPDGPDRLLPAAEDWAAAADGAGDEHAAVGVRGGAVVAVIGAPSGRGASAAKGRAAVRQLARSLGATMRERAGVMVSVGASRPTEDALDTHEAYRQAMKAIEVGRRVRGPGAVTHFEDLGAFRVLSLVPDADELRAFAADVLGPLAAGGPRHADMQRTLRVLIETNGNVAEAARRLHYHYNTLRYRIEKLEQMVGPFLDDHEIRLNVQLALHILEMPLPPASGRPAAATASPRSSG